MSVFNLFQKSHKPTKNLLRIFADLGKLEYSNDEKIAISESYINIAKMLLSNVKLKFDISGSGYGISKGSQYFGEKAYRNKLSKKGYGAMWGMRVRSEEKEFESGFLLFTKSQEASHMEGHFLWPLNPADDYEHVKHILNTLDQVCKISYAYSYPVHKKVMYDESLEKNRLFVYTSIVPKEEKLWSSRTSEISEGKIKKLYPINYFNSKQLKHLVEINPDEKIQVENNSEIWSISNDEIKRGNWILPNVILKEK